jgi:hypothetical protein
MKNLTLTLALAFISFACCVGCVRPYAPPVITGGVGVTGYAGIGNPGFMPGATGAVSPYGGSIYAGTAADPRTAYAVAAYDQARLAARTSSYALSAPPIVGSTGTVCVGGSCPLPPEAEPAESGGDSDLVRGLVDQTLANTEAIEELRERLDD